MSTWHQRHGEVTPLWHTTKWTTVGDGPQRHTTVATFDTSVQAFEHARVTGNYVLPPAPGGRK
jgi:hypothetical protein